MTDNDPSTSAPLSESVAELLKSVQESREEVKSAREELRGVRKELQMLYACFCSSSTKLQALTQQNAQFLDILLKQGHHLQGLNGAAQHPVQQQGEAGVLVQDPQQGGGAAEQALAPPAKRRRTEAEKEVIREEQARQLAAAQLRERAEAGNPLPPLESGVMLVVYPGVDGTPQWTGRWEGEFAATCDYPSVEAIWNEWESGIVYKGGLQKTVPLARLEEDLAFKRSVWRRSKKLRNRMHTMKMILYYVLKQAGQESKSHLQVVRELDKFLAAQVSEGKSQKAITSLALEKIKAEEPSWKPSWFETNVLQWPSATDRKRSATTTADGNQLGNSESD